MGCGGGGVGRGVGVFTLVGTTLCIVTEGVTVVWGWMSTGDGLLWVARRCSISCSCCSALTNAVFSRFVCSALSAFLTLVVTHCSHITFGSFDTENRELRSNSWQNSNAYFSTHVGSSGTWRCPFCHVSPISTRE